MVCVLNFLKKQVRSVVPLYTPLLKKEKKKKRKAGTGFGLAKLCTIQKQYGVKAS
jgi:hypothetical protein